MNSTNLPPQRLFTSRQIGDNLIATQSGISSSTILAFGQTSIRRMNDDGGTWTVVSQMAANDSVRLDQEHLVAIGNNGVIERSTDDGRTWNRIEVSQEVDLSDLAYLSKANVLLALGSSSDLKGKREKNVLLRSGDGGLTWNALDPKWGYPVDRLVALEESQTLLAASDLAITFRSEDAGETWVRSERKGLPTMGRLNSIVSVTRDKLVAVGKGGIALWSDDQGRSWTAVNAGTEKTFYSAAALPNSQTVIAVGEGGLVRRSQDGGKTWQFVFSNRTGSLLSVMVSSADPSVVLVVGESGTILRSKNQGATFEPIETRTHRDLNSVADLPMRGSIIAVGDGSTVLQSSDEGLSWSQVFLPVPTGTSYSAVTFANGKSIAAGGDRGLAISEDEGLTWKTPREASNVWLSRVIVMSDNKTIIGTGDDGGGLTSRDAGRTWSRLTLSASTSDVVSTSTNALIAVGMSFFEPAILRSADFGENWTEVEFPHNGDVNAVLALNSQVLLVLGTNSLLLRSTDDGIKWVAVNDGGANALTAGAASSDGRTAVVVGTRGTILRTQDQGKTWTAVASGTQAHLNAISASQDGKTFVAVGDNGTVVRSLDEGRSWSALTIDESTRDLYRVLGLKNSNSFVATGKGTVLRSDDLGKSWTSVLGSSESNFWQLLQTSSGTVAALGEQTILLDPTGARLPSLTQVIFSVDPIGTLTVALQVSDPDSLCSDTCVSLRGIRAADFASGQPFQKLPSPVRESGDRNHWKSSVNARKLLRAEAGEDLHFEIVLHSDSFSSVYPIDQPSFRISAPVNREFLYWAGALGFLILTIWSLYVFRPIALLRATRYFGLLEELTKSTSVVREVVGVLGKLAVAPALSRAPRVLDAWSVNAAPNLLRQLDLPEEGARADFCPLPVTRTATRERTPSPAANDFRPDFARKRAYIVLEGPGGAGKTTLARQLARWGSGGLLTGYPSLPVWVDDDVQDPEQWLIGRVRALSGDSDLPDDIIKALFRRKRLLVVVDRLSERKRETHDAWVKRFPSFVNAVIVTTRAHAQLHTDAIHVALEPLNASNLGGFIDHLLLTNDLESRIMRLGDRVELSQRLVRAVTIGRAEGPVTPLLAKLFVLTALDRLTRSTTAMWETLPASVPQVYLDYLASVNPPDLTAPNFVSTERMFAVAKALAIVELGKDFRPKQLPIRDAREALRLAELPDGAKAGELDPVQRLIDNGVIERRTLLGTDYVRFQLDPIAEYVGAIGMAEACSTDPTAWKELVDSVVEKGAGAKGFLVALLTTHHAHAQQFGWPLLSIGYDE